GANVGKADGAFRARASSWIALNRSAEILVGHHARKQNGQSCSPLFYKGTQATFDADPANSAFTVTAPQSDVPLADNTGSSTTNAGPASANCVTQNQGVPWFYNGCCTTCPTFNGGYWPDEAHPMASYLASNKDLNGKVLNDVCGGDTPVS